MIDLLRLWSRPLRVKRPDRTGLSNTKCGKKGNYKNKCKEEEEMEKTETPAQEKGKAVAAVAVSASTDSEDQEW